ncbi:MAG: hypothetical protein Kow0025_10390 [Thermodesulfovibrionales bacterium]
MPSRALHRILLAGAALFVLALASCYSAGGVYYEEPYYRGYYRGYYYAPYYYGYPYRYRYHPRFHKFQRHDYPYKYKYPRLHRFRDRDDHGRRDRDLRRGDGERGWEPGRERPRQRDERRRRPGPGSGLPAPGAAFHARAADG